MNPLFQALNLSAETAARQIDPRDLPIYRACVRDVVSSRHGYAVWCHTHQCFGPIRDSKADAEFDVCVGTTPEINNAIARLFGLHQPQLTDARSVGVAQTDAKG